MSTLPAAELSSSSEAAFAELYERHADRIFGFCRRRLRSRQEAEDAVQETFVSALRALKRGSVPVCESAWLFKIAENVCFAVYRSGARRHVRDLSHSERIARLAARDQDGETLIGLDEALDTLPLNQRRAFVLRELRGLSYKEIAIQLGVSVAAVETLIYRARRGLAHALESGAGLRSRLTASVNLGSIVAAAKGWFAGATAVKVASTAAVAALASLAAGDALQRLGEPPPAPAPATRPAGINRSVLWGGRRGHEERQVPTTKPAHRGAPGSLSQSRPRPPWPVKELPTPTVDNSVATETLVVRPSHPGRSEPASPAGPTPTLPISAPPVPQPPADEPVDVKLPDIPEAVAAVPGVPTLPEIPAVGDLVPEIPVAGDLVPELPQLP